MKDDKVGVVGCGTMGIGIVEVAAVRGHSVVAVDAAQAACDSARERLRVSLERQHAAGRLAEEPGDVLARVQIGTDLALMADRDVVIEAVVEREDVKRDIFTRLAAVVSDSCLLATNTSSLPVTRIAASTPFPGRVVGLHFFNPVPRMNLVEVVHTPLTGEGVVDRAVAFVQDVLGKRTIVASDRSGFVVNVLLVPYLLSAMRLHDNGLASAEDIDTGMEGGCGMPMGPLRLADLIGLDVLLMVADCLWEEHRDAVFVAPPGFRRLVDAGHLGRKSGRGYYDYTAGA